MTTDTPPRLTMLHTAPANVAAFALLATELAPDVPVRHVLAADLLDDARAHGITDALRARVATEVGRAADDGASVVLCTCSTIGDLAERSPMPAGGTVLRVDRAMAEAAVAAGPRIGVAAALESTLAPTEELLREVAEASGAAVELRRILCTEAWALLDAGDREGFLGAVAEAVRAGSAGCDVVVLAQASIAGAAERLGDLGVPVLSSPRLGLEAALALVREAAATRGPLSVAFPGGRCGRVARG